MAKKAVTLAKLSRPRLHGNYPRQRLFALLDERRRCPVLWIAGPPGAGKTTLAASYLDVLDLPSLWYQLDSGDGDPASFFYYLRQAAAGLSGRKRAPLPLLTPEYLADLSGFARRWFRELLGRLPKGVVLVLDNYQEVPAESALHRMLATATEEIHEGANLIVLSRTDPPAEFSRLLASDRLATVDWNELRLTLEEARAIAAMREPLKDEQLRELYSACDGWAAGFTLMRERHRRIGDVNRLGEPLPHETVFDYFATQFFDDAPPAVRDTLVRTSFLPRFTVPMAVQLSGNPQAGELLAHLHEQHLFIDCRSGAELTYQYHALFRSFLSAQARSYYTPLGMAQIRELAASLLEKQFQIDEAVDLYLTAQAHDPAVRLILRHAESMVAAGRAQTLREWISRLPTDVTERFPWIAYWSGACSLPTDPASARSVFERACAAFGERHDILGEIKAAAGIIDSYWLERADFIPLDPWIDLIFDRIAKRPAFASAADELAAVSSTMIATLYRQPSHSRLPLLVARTRELLEAEVGVNQKVAAAAFLLNYFAWTGETARAEELIALVRPLLSHPELAPLRRASWELRLAIHHLALGEFDKTRASVMLAEHIARDNSFGAIEVTAHMFETLFFLTAADIERAEAALARVDAQLSPTRRMDYSIALKFKGWVALAKGDVDTAVQFGEHAREVGEAAGAPNMHSHTLIYLAHFYTERHDYEKAHAALADAHACTTLERYPVFHFDAAIVRADLLLEEGNRTGCEAALRTALTLGARRGYLNSLFWLPRMMERLCAFALERGIETDYVTRLIRHRNLQPPASNVDEWPWQVKLFTLGGFALLKDDRPIEFSRKTPKKPLALLKAVVAFGGEEVPESRLTEALWQDEEGDAGHQAFAVAVHRLRRLLGNDDIVQIHEGRVGLNPRRCWVDVWAFERLLIEADNMARAGDREESARLLMKALDLYRGALFAEDSDAPWTISARERLRSLFIRHIGALAGYLHGLGRHDEAVTLYLRGIDADPLAEEFYQGLMRCYRDTARRAEALAIYRRLRQTISVTLGVTPSPASEALYRALLAGTDAR